MDKNDNKKERKDSLDHDDIKLEKPSYTYWKRDSDKAADHTGFQPQPSSEKIEEHKNPVGSAWNKAGTWEEKKLNKNQILDFINNYLSKNRFKYKDSFELEKLTSFSGDVYYVFSRGKIKFVYDCEIKLKIIGVNDLSEENTEITINEVSNADLDDDFEFEYEKVSKKDNEDKYKLIQIFQTCKKDVQKDIRKLFDLLKEYYLK